jgi:pyridoxamine 5'-phosphate oxidase
MKLSFNRLGYALQPDCFEFWQGQTNRVHDRIVYQLEEQEEDDNNKNQKTPIWKMKRLAP